MTDGVIYAAAITDRSARLVTDHLRSEHFPTCHIETTAQIDDRCIPVLTRSPNAWLLPEIDEVAPYPGRQLVVVPMGAYALTATQLWARRARHCILVRNGDIRCHDYQVLKEEALEIMVRFHGRWDSVVSFALAALPRPERRAGADTW